MSKFDDYLMGKIDTSDPWVAYGLEKGWLEKKAEPAQQPRRKTFGFGEQKPVDTRTFQQYDPSNPVAQKQIGSSPVGVVLPNNPYREEAKEAVLKNVAQAMTDPMMGTFAGETALANLVKAKAPQAEKLAADFAEAKRLHAAGVPDREIHAQTGWTKGFPDKQWRFEIPDNEARFIHDEVMPSNTETTLSKVLTNSPAVDAYKLGELPVTTFRTQFRPDSPMDPGGFYSGRHISVNYEHPSQGKSTTLHELQHAVQEREGFAKGGSPSDTSLVTRPKDFKTVASNIIWNDPTASTLATPILRQRNIIMERLAESGNTRAIDTFDKHYNNALGTSNALWSRGQAEFDLKNILTPSEQSKFFNAVDKYRSEASPLIDIIDSERRTYNKMPSDPQEAYRRLAGEAEARLTANRMNLTAKERGQRYPVSEFDVPVEQQIVRGVPAGVEKMYSKMRDPKSKAMLERQYPEITGSLENSQGQKIPQPTNFKNWFGGSKVVDEQGKPLVVYHGTTADIKEFKTGGSKYGRVQGAYFTSNPDSWKKMFKGEGKAAYPVYLKIEHPAYRSDIDTLVGYGKSGIEARELLQSKGFDGVIDTTMDEIIVFSPTQIKSVYNRGTFNPKDPNILKGVGGAVGLGTASYLMGQRDSQ